MMVEDWTELQWEDWKKKRRRGLKSGPGWKGSYLFTKKDGTTFIVHSINKFCVENNYSRGNINSVSVGKRKSA